MATPPVLRLIDAASELPPADSALFDLWVRCDLDDRRLAVLAGMPLDTVLVRRDRILASLGERTEMSPPDVRKTLEQLRESADPVPPAMAPPTPAPAPPPTPPSPPAPAARRGGRRPAVLGTLVVLLLALAVVLIALPGRHHRAASVRTVASTTSTASSTATTSTAASTSTDAALAPLPGGLPHARGTARIVRSGAFLYLDLSVRGLPRLAHGHYEAWLYDSVIDSVALGRVRRLAPVRLRLPAGAHAYRSIDISAQPPGAHGNSGESRLRAPNPERTPN